MIALMSNLIAKIRQWLGLGKKPDNRRPEPTRRKARPSLNRFTSRRLRPSDIARAGWAA